MDLYKAIHQLELERMRIEESIRHLEQVLELGHVRRGRGRRFMPEAERQLVSNRMREYWANRRQESREKKKAAREQVLVMAKSA